MNSAVSRFERVHFRSGDDHRGPLIADVYQKSKVRKKVKLRLAIAIASALTLQVAVADELRTPVARVIVSKGGNHLLKMVPAQRRKDGDEYVISRDAFGVAYKVT